MKGKVLESDALTSAYKAARGRLDALTAALTGRLVMTTRKKADAVSHDFTII